MLPAIIASRVLAVRVEIIETERRSRGRRAKAGEDNVSRDKNENALPESSDSSSSNYFAIYQ